MIRTIILATYLIPALIFSIPSLMKAKLLEKKGKLDERNRLAFEVVSKMSRRLIKLSGSQIKVVGEENIPRDKAVLFVSNHQSNFDILLLLGFIDKPKAFIAKVELMKIPILSQWMKAMGCIFIDRKDVRQSLRAINEGANILKEGHSLVIFPEGTRSKDGQLGQFKHGSFKLATKSNVPIIPVTINGAYKIMPKGKLIIKPSKVEMIISKPIYADEEIKRDSKMLADKVKNIIEENLKN
ncbi:1-acyl-sn-glycerol-3-phosphate acyltransferase [Caminicella sporogenes DSM 14501]|uniref:1-acyl-sn-glycerol-3-phosphate acyltransferase n=1 Tax=Caminicella sporogenes DSM 14501 TaxID=1121266 RepID=A0A1M6NLS8_9FIRM|nr:lysophospholipid acyltransferase family protein [Caminicella sporogenes]RKD22159.1 acyl-phosphate glycerol 3-phosphate acyltransferase [Caminicella sporogenes]SHJ96659.1 1-acyl-sn-glycerol-3-phosphate acyltransferase [Caminicella sporogenes DSM 14501]